MRVLILFCLLALAFANNECGENQHHEDCGTACPLTCENHHNPPQFCNFMCKYGCHCDVGYVKTSDGQCVRPEQCPSAAQEVCGENERFEECGTACPLTCDNYANPPMVCVRRCDIGCHCAEGYVRDEATGRCVRPEQCPSKAQEVCGENERFEECGTACPLTCDNYDNPPKFCVKRCDIGCHCAEGYVKDKATGRCVRPEQCPNRAQEVCGENESFDSCGSACPLTCDNHKNPPRFCTLQCSIGCRCAFGYVRDEATGRCVRPEQCPNRAQEVCGENELFEDCGSACPLTCENHDNPPKTCILKCERGCRCGVGYVRDNNGRCVKPEQCPTKTPQVCDGLNEEFQECGSACPLTCDNPKEPHACIMVCKTGCHCKKGYVRNSQEVCVLPEDCPQTNAVCGTNQRHNQCGTACPLTCDNYNDPPKVCVAMCVTGCECQEGYVKNKAGECVKPKDCPSNAQPVCGRNERYTNCGSACPLTCDNHNDAPHACVDMCVSGCFCEEGYVRASSGQCIRSIQCPINAQGQQQARAELCSLEAETGRCRGYFPRYYFNQDSGKCEKFIYGGCGGNENNFETIEECHQGCAATAVGKAGISTDCLLEEIRGPCKAAIPRWRFTKEAKCVQFIYGGCGGNANNFKSKEECEGVCHLDTGASSGVGDCLEEEKVVGPCRASMPRWSFNKITGKCEKFIYGGCGGSKNNFEAVEDCRNLCVAGRAAPTACMQEKVIGPCKAAFKRFFFNTETGKCESFIYGGCQGNSNNFNNEDECHAVCAA